MKDAKVKGNQQDYEDSHIKEIIAETKKISLSSRVRNEKQRETNANNLLEWYEKLPDNSKKMNEGVKIYATQLKNSVKG